MKLYWRCKDVPELADLSRAQRRKVVRHCFFSYGLRDWHFWVAFLAEATCIIAGGIIGIILRYGFGFPAFVDYTCRAVGLLLGLSIYTVMYCGVITDRLRPHFRDYIAERNLRA
jgi:hypothetical protein